ncbi:hypothetical protein JCM21900_003735 [Sporobolomyces salmonicolor]
MVLIEAGSNAESAASLTATTSASPAGTLVLVRHGQSETNASNIFTGLLDPPLTARGISESSSIGSALRSLPLPSPLSCAYTSPLLRARSSTSHLLASLAQSPPPPIFVSAALNERDYGALNGRDKDEVASEYGRETCERWRRGYGAVPPGGESLEMTAERVWAFYEAEVWPRMRKGETVLVVSHGNTLRALVARLEGLDRPGHVDEEGIMRLTLGTGALRIYKIGKDGSVVDRRLFVSAEGIEGGKQ